MTVLGHITVHFRWNFWFQENPLTVLVGLRLTIRSENSCSQISVGGVVIIMWRKFNVLLSLEAPQWRSVMCPGEISICTSSHCYSDLKWLFRKLLWALRGTKELMSKFLIRLCCMKAVLSKCHSGWCLFRWSGSHCCPNDLEQVILLQNCLPNQTSGIMIWVAGSIDLDMADWKNPPIRHPLCVHTLS